MSRNYTSRRQKQLLCNTGYTIFRVLARPLVSVIVYRLQTRHPEANIRALFIHNPTIPTLNLTLTLIFSLRHDCGDDRSLEV